MPSPLTGVERGGDDFGDALSKPGQQHEGNGGRGEESEIVRVLIFAASLLERAFPGSGKGFGFLWVELRMVLRRADGGG